jgi:hypothetical protein
VSGNEGIGVMPGAACYEAATTWRYIPEAKASIPESLFPAITVERPLEHILGTLGRKCLMLLGVR